MGRDEHLLWRHALALVVAGVVALGAMLTTAEALRPPHDECWTSEQDPDLPGCATTTTCGCPACSEVPSAGWPCSGSTSAASPASLAPLRALRRRPPAFPTVAAGSVVGLAVLSGFHVLIIVPAGVQLVSLAAATLLHTAAQQRSQADRAVGSST